MGRELRYALRMLWKSRALSAIIIAILAIGIGASASMFSLIDACLINNIPYPVVDRWIAVRARLSGRDAYSNFFSVPELSDLQSLNDTFEAVGAIHGDSFVLSTGDYPEQIPSTRVTASAVTMTGVKPLLGRTFLPEEDRPGGPHVVLLSYELWQQRYSGDQNILGKSLELSGERYTVVGVMPPYFGLWGGQLWAPFQLDLANRDRNDRRFWVTAVLRPGVSETQARARLNTISKQWEQQYGGQNPEYSGMQLTVSNVKEAVNGNIKPALLVLLGAVGLLLLIGCGNVANLLLARSTGRQREMAIRAALGAGRLRVARQMLLESLLLSIAGGVAGVLLAVWLVPLLVHLIPTIWLTTAPELVRINFRVIGAVVALSLLTGLLFGLLPALQAGRINLTDALKQGDQRAGGDRHSRIARRLLVVAEVALSVVVLTSAALMIKSYQRLESLDLGFAPDHLLSFNLALRGTKYSASAQVGAFYEEMIRRIDALPGVESAATVSGRPMAYRGVDVSMRDFTIEGRAVENAQARPNASYRFVSPDYFSVMETPLRRGRWFSNYDGAESPRVAVINGTMAQLFWPNADPIGQRIHLSTAYGHDPVAGAEDSLSTVTIVGVVADANQIRTIDAPVRQEFYLPQPQWPNETRAMAVLVRGSADVTQLTSSIRRAIATIDPELPVADVRTMNEIVADSFGPKRLTTFVLVFFAVVALILASLGQYAVLSYSVGQRVREIGVRLALGAQRRDVLKLVIVEGFAVTLVGLGVGLGAALALTRLMNSLLFGVGAGDPTTLLGVSLCSLIAALLACWIPARRATKVDPLVALKSE